MIERFSRRALPAQRAIIRQLHFLSGDVAPFPIGNCSAIEDDASTCAIREDRS